MSKITRKSSVVIGQNVPALVGKVLEGVGCRVGQSTVNGDFVDFAVNDSGREPPERIVFSLISALVKEACGASKGIIKRPDGDVTLDVTTETAATTFGAIVAAVDINFDELPADEGVAAIAEMTYMRCVSTCNLGTTLLINQFPVCLRPENCTRIDFAINGAPLLSYRRAQGGSSVESTLKCNVKSIETVMGRMCSTTFVESIMPPSWKKMGTMDIPAFQELLDELESRITDYWTDSDKSDRCRAYASFLMSAVGAELRKVFRDRCNAPETVDGKAPANPEAATVPTGVFRCPRKLLDNAVNLMDDWAGMCLKLTTLTWGSEWGNQPFKDSSLQRCRDRLSAIGGMRDALDDINRLLDASDIRSLRGDTAKDVFDTLDVFDTSPSTDTRWQAALSSFNRRLEPLEHRCAVKLRDFLATRMSLPPQVILNEFSQFKELAKRPVIVKALCTERDTLLAKLSERIQGFRLEFEQRQQPESKASISEDKRLQAARFTPVSINRVVWLRQVRGKVEQMQQLAASMLSDLGRSSDFMQTCKVLASDIQQYEQDVFKNWVFDIHENAKTLHLSNDNPVIVVSGDGKINVNYPERLVELLREVRLFKGLGFDIPKDIQAIATQAYKFYPNGVALGQISRVFNSTEKEILKCTQAMFVDSALAFDKVIGSGNTTTTGPGGKVTGGAITWSKEADTDKYVQKLRAAASTVNEDLRLIKRIHNEITAITLELFKIDLLRSKERWLTKVSQIREKIDKSGYNNTTAWVAHWDKQIYKALEYQYQVGLESLTETLQEIKADIIVDVKTGRAVCRPPIAQLKQTYYHTLREFITFPCRFVGISGASSAASAGAGFAALSGTAMFRKIVGHNERALMTVFTASASLFRKIDKEVKRFQPMLILGQCGLNGNPKLVDIVGSALTETQQWEANFRLLKQKGREIGSVETFIKVDCFTLCTAGVKSAIEEQLSKLAEVLQITLKKSAMGHLDKIDKFLNDAASTMDQQYTKLDDMNKAHLKQAVLHEQRPTYDAEFHHFHSKNSLLQSVTNSQGIDASETLAKWEAFVGRLESFEKEMESQMEKLKLGVGTAVAEFLGKVEKLSARWHETKPKDPKSTVSGISLIEKHQSTLDALMKEGEELAAQCAFFHLDDIDRTPLDDLKHDMVYYRQVWEVTDKFNAECKVFREENWITFRAKVFKFDDFLKHWQDALKDLPANPISLFLRTCIDEWSRVIPLLKFVRGDVFTPAHWTELFKLIRLDRMSLTVDSLLFGHLLDAREEILKADKPIKALHARAQGEAQIREALDEIRNWAASTQFKLVPHPDRKGVTLITEWKEVMSAVNDNQALLMSFKENPHFGPFAEDAKQWETKLLALDDYLHVMVLIQRKWVYLEPIFARGALPQEQQRFQRTDKDYLGVMKEVEKDPRVISLAAHPEYKEKLKLILEQLDKCQKALNEFLEQKRDRFPRFYFISDDDLLEILGQSKNPAVIQTHLKKLFMGIHSVKFDAKQKYITEIMSFDTETVVLSAPVEIREDVEDWLKLLDEEMQKTLQKSLITCLQKLEVAIHSSQILCLCEQVNFTTQVEKAFKEHGKNPDSLKMLKANLQQQLRDLTTFAAGNTNLVLDLKLKALIMDLIHSIEVVDLLIKEQIYVETDWLWRKQLRYYVERGLSFIKMVDAPMKYSYEYQGNAPKLVHTPLTDRCYLTLTQGMHLGYGGNPYGPAGTGKTESVKALGNCLGRQVLVFNCDEGIDFKSMGRIFTGLVKCGAWGCFDEFNRLKVDQLSAVSQMIQVIQEALKSGDDKCMLLGRQTEVNNNAGIFVTLNPAGKHYGGRSKLPDNLKQLFRSVAMSVPDNRLIAETIFYSEGFENAAELGNKVVEIFRLSKQLLSQQQHYDWGLRALKAVLRLGGGLIKQFLKERVTTGAKYSPSEILRLESEIVIKSLRVNTLSKLTFDDVKLFNALVADVFPGVAVTEIVYTTLKPAILEAITELKLQLVESQVQKVLQLYEAMNQRMGVVLVGPSGSGKSTLLKILRKAMQKMGTLMPMWVMNPKAMHRDQLLGRMDMDTREWFDGVLTEAAKKVVKEEATTRSWIYCDGDIDPEWVESLNSVLDDNKLLTMPNGVRIQFGSNVNFVFETHTLQFASPATVSRMGMIFLSEEDVDLKAPVATWVAEQPADIQGKLKAWLAEHLEKAIGTLLATKALVVDTTKMGLVMSALSQLNGCNNKAQFAMGLIMGLGSYLSEAARLEFAKDIFHMTGERPAESKAPLDCYFDPNRGGLVSFQPAPPLEATVDQLSNYPMVRTIEVQRSLAVIDAWIQGPHYRPFVLVGPEGCGKTMLLRNAFSSLVNVKVAMLNCSAQTVAVHVIRKLQQMCQVFNTTQGRVLRPKDADRLILVLKDLNLPKPDKYATVQLHSFLQQLILYNGFYDHDLEWVSVERLQIVASMNPPGSMGRFPVASRFVAIVSVLNLAMPSTASLQIVYNEFASVLLSSPQLQSIPFGVPGKGPIDLSKVMIAVFDFLTKKFSVDDASHYIFTPRDLTRWLLNLQLYMNDQAELLEMFAYEGIRMFSDRLVKAEDRTKFEKTLADQLHAVLSWSSKKGASGDDKEPRVFSSWLANTTKVKKLATTKLEDLRKAADQNIQLYARENGDLDIQLVSETVHWMARLDRVLIQPGGHAMLVARSGMSVSAVVALCAFQLRLPVFGIFPSKQYGVKQFQTDLKPAIQMAGSEGNNCVLVLEDHNLGNPTFLEMINSLLSSGEIPGLFSNEETEAMIGPLKEEASAEGCLDGAYGYFVDRVMRNLHIVVIMDPTHPDYESRCRSNPALFTRCSVCWVGAFAPESLRSLPKYVMKDVFRALDKLETAGDFKLSKELVAIHQGAGDRFSPQHFKTLLLTYKEIFKTKSQASGEVLGKLEKGLAKLAEAEQNVAVISTEVTQKKIEMEQKQKEADEALVEIEAKMKEAAEQKKQVQKVTKEIDAEQAIITEKKTAIQKQLSGIQPTLDAAKEAVGQIKNEHLSELNALKTPPPAVQDVLEGVMNLLGKSNETTWAAIRKVMAGGAIKQLIMQFDAKNITPGIRDTVTRFLDAKANSFKPEVIARASQAAAPMALWVRANIDYSLVLDRIQPLTSELASLEGNLQKGVEKLQKLEDKLKKLDQKREELTKKFGEKTKEAERLKLNLEQAESTLTAAQDLLGKLSAEKVRWSKQVGSIQQESDLVPKKALLASAFITYLGREPEDVRRKITQQWKDQYKITEFNFFTFLRSESMMLQYKAQGLPGDDLSMENAVVILEQVRCALIVDPANQASDWLRKNLKSKDVIVENCTMADERFTNTLELAIRFGKTLLINEVDRIDPMLYPLIRKDFLVEGPKKVVRLGGEKTVDYHENFQLFLLTRATDLKLSPDIAGYLSEVSFTITRGGLEGQLLGATIQHEQPELEQQKLKMLETEEGLKLQVAGLEETLLKELASSQGSLLENKSLIDSLNQIKTQALTINEMLVKGAELAKELDEKREVYRPFAAKGSAIFFLMRDLKSLSHMYQFSLGMFLTLFRRTLEQMKGVQMGPQDKIKKLEGLLVQSVVLTVSRALFKADRITFGVHLAKNLEENCCTEQEWLFFTGRAVAAPVVGAAKEDLIPSWVAKDCTPQYKMMRDMFPALIKSMNIQETDTWYHWMRSATPEEEIPESVQKHAKKFQQLMIVGALRPDRLIAASQMWACRSLDVPSLSDSSNLATLIPLTTHTEPIICITTPGADPSQELQALAYEKVGKQNFFQLAMGGGQQEEAMRLLHQCATQGQWLCLKNLHLVIPWVQELEQELNTMTLHKDFRLWLTSEPHDSFPSILLSSSLKITFEAPPGLKQNMLRAYNQWTPEWLAEKSPQQAQLLFCLAYLHAIVQERRSYIPQGWAKFYEFSQADLKSAADIIIAQSSGGGPGTTGIDWKTIHGVLENAIYGGRMETEFDVRILRTYLNRFFHDALIIGSGKKMTAQIIRGVNLPSQPDHEAYSKIVASLPDADIPSMFSLPPNADRVVQRSRVAAMVNDLVKLQERREMSKMSKDEWAASLQPVLTAWMQLCQPHGDLLTTSVGGKRDPRPIEGFVGAELDDCILLLRQVEDTMSSLKKVIDGTLLLSERLKAESAAMISGEVPLTWDGHFSGPEQILPWLASLVSKAAAIRKWSTLAADGSLMSGRMNLADLFRPQTFLNALRQETARTTGEPLVSLQLVASIGNPPPKCALSIVATNLLLQSAVLDGDVLAEVPAADSPAVQQMPDVFLGWVPPHEEDPSTVVVPVYAALNKEVLLTELAMKCSSPAEVPKYVLSGIAIAIQE